MVVVNHLTNNFSNKMGKSIKCTICNVTLTTKYKLNNHLKTKRHQVNKDAQKYEIIDHTNLNNLFDIHHQRSSNIKPIYRNRFDIKVYKSAFKKLIVQYRITPIKQNVNYESVINSLINLIHRKFKDELKNNVKINISLMVNYRKLDDEIEVAHAISDKILYSEVILARLMKSIKKELIDKIENFEGLGSGWIFNNIKYIDLKVKKYDPLRAGSYIELPKWIKNKKAVLNIKNEDNECIIWCILAYLYPVDRLNNPDRVKNYKEYKDEIKTGDIKFPMEMNDKNINKLEKLNNISLNIFGIGNNSIYPIKISENKKENDIKLLVWNNEKNNHFGLIRNFQRLVNNELSYNNSTKTCERCFQVFYNDEKYNDHIVGDCLKFKPVKTILPTEGSTLTYKYTKDGKLNYTNFKKQYEQPVYIVADFESFIKKDGKHIPAAFGYKVVSKYEKLNRPYKCIINNNNSEEFIQRIIKILIKIAQLNDCIIKNTNIPYDKNEINKFEKLNCHICNNPLNGDHVIDHDHLNGQIRGYAHEECNINFNPYSGKNYITPLIFHNAKNYDNHFLINEIAKHFKMDVLSETLEKYKTIKFDKIKIIDSYLHLPKSLEQLVIAQKELSITNQEFEHPEIINRKLIFPYSKLESQESFNIKLKDLKIEDFYNDLKDEECEIENYEFFKELIEKYGLINLKDLMELYLKADVLLLADIFENYRKMGIEYFNLDPLNFLTSPAFSDKACLKHSNIESDLLTDVEKYTYLETGKRGGSSNITTKNDESNENNKIIYIDANNLYGWCMLQKLPYKNFEWCSDSLDTILNTPDDNDFGYFVEVDLEYPSELKDKFRDYPPAPEHRNVKKTLKLCATLEKKYKYVVHYRTLKLYVQIGLKITKFHRALKFEQDYIYKNYIEFCTEQRQKNKDEAFFWKLMVNSLYGKSLEDPRKYNNFEIVNDSNRYRKLNNKPFVIQNEKIFYECNNEEECECIVGVNKFKNKINLEKPIYLGIAILDLAKYKMYDIWYNDMKNIDKKLLFTDTDSFCMSVKTKNVYDELKKYNWMDFSNFPKDSKYYSEENKMIPGKMKDELGGVEILEFVGLRSKCYSYKTKDFEKHSHKGIKPNKNITHEIYKKVLFEKENFKVKQKYFKTIDHEVFTEEIEKIALSSYDDKRIECDDGINTIPYGYE